jgi:hypothetical protein
VTQTITVPSVPLPQQQQELNLLKEENRRLKEVNRVLQGQERALEKQERALEKNAALRAQAQVPLVRQIAELQREVKAICGFVRAHRPTHAALPSACAS